MRSVRFVVCGEGLLAAVSDLVVAFGIFVVFDSMRFAASRRDFWEVAMRWWGVGGLEGVLTKYIEIFNRAKCDLSARGLSVLLEKWKLASLVRGHFQLFWVEN